MKQTENKKIPVWGAVLGAVCAVLLCAVLVATDVFRRSPSDEQTEVQNEEASTATAETQSTSEDVAASLPEEQPNSNAYDLLQEDIAVTDHDIFTEVSGSAEESSAQKGDELPSDASDTTSNPIQDGGFTFED